MRRFALALLGVAALAGPFAATSGAQQRITPAPAPAAGDASINQATVEVTTTPIYVPAPWETPDLQFPLLSDEAVVAVHQDDDQLKFVVGNELGAFRPAPKGGSAFFGQGRPIFGIAAPPILPSRILRPLGTGDAGDRFLGAPPVIPDNTVIPQIGQTFDDRRQSFAFLDGPPAVTSTGSSGSTQFPLTETLAADVNGPLPDNIETPAPPTTTPTTTPPETVPDRPTPGTTPSSSTTTPTTAPPPGTTIPVTTTTLPARPTTTVPVRTTTTTTEPVRTTTTTTERPTTTTTQRPTTTTSTSTTSTTSPPTTLPPEPTRPSTAFVLGNQRESASYCLSNADGGSDNPNCDRLFDLSKIRPGQPTAVNLTLWNVDPDSDTDAVDLRMFSSGGCVDGLHGNALAGTGNLCDGLQLKVERYASPSRTGSPSECLYGCGANYGGSLNQFATSHSSMANGVRIGNRFVVNEKAYLVITVLLPDTGNDSSGRGRDNKYQGHTATLRLTWRMVSA